jgi:predicted amidohydrolase YtcJ
MDAMKSWACFAAVVAMAVGCHSGSSTTRPSVAGGADAIYFGGAIVTVDDARPTAEAVAVDDGRIVFVGSRADAMRLKGASTKLVDLHGRTLAPGLIDGHAHFLAFGAQAIGANLLAEPDGDVKTIDDVVAKLQAFAKGPDVNLTGWIFGSGYDDSLLGRHPTAEDLDRVSTEVPVVAVHISGHFCVVNTAGLKKVGYTADTKDPVGGVIRRKPGTNEPNGVLEELAAIPVIGRALATREPAGADYTLSRAQELAASFGYTTVIEGRAFGANDRYLRSAADRGLLKLDVVSFIDYADRRFIRTPLTNQYDNRYRVGGMKITLDGSPQGRTAWRNTPYLLPPDGQQTGYKGYPAIPDTAAVQALLDEAYAKNWPVHVHANGDAAIDQLIAALKPVVARHGLGDRRTTLIHGQFVRPGDQLDALKQLDVIASLFPMHTFYWGDWYTQIVGPEQAQQISPIKTALKKGLRVNSHTDAPVALPNLMQVMDATVNRTSRSGKLIGADERLTPLEALKCVTLWPAYELFEEKTKGSIEVGKRADLVILSANPLTVDPKTIGRIVVLETIKDGQTVYRRE